VRIGQGVGEDGPMSKRNVKNAHLVEPTWGESEDGGPPLTELSASVAGGLSPFGQDHDFPMPVELVRYAHPTDKPNRAGVQLPENR
jgi:hypothetical protein